MGTPNPKSITPVFETFANENQQLVPIPMSCIPLGKTLPYSVYLKAQPGKVSNFISLRRPGEKVTADWLALLGPKVEVVYVKRMHWEQFVQGIEKFDPVNGPKDLVKQVQVGRNLAITFLTDAEVKGRLDKPNYERLKILSEWLALSLRGVDDPVGMMVRYKDASVYFANHAYNMGILSAIVAYQLGLGVDAVRLVVLSAMFHNVGNLEIPRSILYKEGDFTKEEWERIKSHPSRGGEILYALNAPREVILTTMQHHERLDGKGYPELILGHEIHLFAKILSVADVFDALQSHRPHSTPMSREETIKVITGMEKKFEGQILNIVSSLKE